MTSAFKRFLSACLCVMLTVGCIPAVSEEALNGANAPVEETLVVESIPDSGNPTGETSSVEELPEDTQAADPGDEAAQGNPENAQEAQPDAIDFSLNAGLNPAFTNGYAQILEPGAAVYESLRADAALVGYIESGVVYVVSRVTGDAEGLEIVCLPEGSTEAAHGWIHPSQARPISPEETEAYLTEAIKGETVVYSEKNVLLGTVVCELEAAPETTEEPEATEEPEVPAEPEATAEPETAEESEDTENPETDAEPEDTEEPEATEEPENTETSEATQIDETDEEVSAADVALEGIRLACSSVVGLKEIVDLKIAPIPEDASLEGLTFSYATSKSKYVAVNQSGQMYGSSKGNATVTVRASNGMQASLKVYVKSAPSSIKLYTSRKELGPGETIGSWYTLSSGSAATVTDYRSSDESILKIDKNGVITAVKPGTAAVAAWTYNKKGSNAVYITVKNAPTKIKPEMDKIKIGAGDSYTLGYTLGENEAGAVTFSSSNPAIAEVDGSGRIKAIAEGNATITMRTYNGAATANVEVEVAPAPEKITLLGKSTVGVGEYIQFTHQIEPAGVVGTVTYSSSNTKYVTVGQDGRVYGKKKGSAYVTAKTYNGKSASIKVYVKSAPTSIKLYTARKELGVGEKIGSWYTLSSGSAATVTDYRSSDESILTIDKDGIITAVKPGTAAVAAWTYNKKGSNAVYITVKNEPTAIYPANDTIKIGAGDSYVLSYTLCENEAGAATFSSSNPAIAEVDGSGRIKAIAEGNATITMETYNGAARADVDVEVVPAPEKITLNGKNTVGVGEYIQFTHQIEPAGVVGTVTYSSSNTKYVTVGQDGRVYGKKKGSAYVTAKTYNGKSASIKVTVKSAPKSISLYTTRKELGVGETIGSWYTLPSGTAATVTDYRSSDESILTVDKSGVITAIKPGTATVKAWTYNKKGSNAVSITVKNAPTKIKPGLTELKIGAGDSYTLGYTLGDNEAGAATFSTSDPAIAKVDDNGRIEAIAEGNATITLKTYNGIESVGVKVQVVPAPEKITLNGKSTVGLGEYVQFTHEIEPAGVVGTVKYSSSKTKYVTVGQDGRVYGKKKGTAYVTAKTYNGKSASIKVTVKPAPTSIKLYTARKELGLGETIVSWYTLSSGSAATVTNYRSSDETVLKVSEKGVITAVGLGTATITAKTYNNKSSNAVSITVRNAPTKIKPNPSELKIGAGDSYTLSYTLGDNEAGAATFSTSDPTIVEVDSNGRIKANAKGSATITLKTYNNAATAKVKVEVTDAPSRVILSGNNQIGIGETTQFTYKFDPEDVVGSVVYKSTNARNATVDQNGVVRGVREGFTYITATAYNGVNAAVKVYIKKAPSSIKLYTPRTEMGYGETMAAWYSLSSGSAATVTDYRSSDETVLKVSENGIITAVGLGTASITARTYNGKNSNAVSITVKKAPTGLKLNSSNAVLGVGQTFNLVPTLVPADSASGISYQVISGNAVSVDATGKVTAENPGTATVRAATFVSGVYAECKFTVYPAPTSISFAESSYTVEVGKKLTLQPILSEGSYSDITYSVKKPGYFTIDAGGTLTAVSRGTTTVTASTYNGKIATVSITVFDPYFPESVTMTNTPPTTMELGDTFTPKLDVFPSTAKLDMVWKSSDESIITVDASTGKITAKSYGRVTITGTSARNPALVIAYKTTILSPYRCFDMPCVHLDVSGKSASQKKALVADNQSKILRIRNSAFMELSALEAAGTISTYELNWRTVVITRAFEDAIFPWVTDFNVAYWYKGYDEGGKKIFQPKYLYFGVPYTQTKRTYNASKLVSNGYYSSTDYSYYKLVKSKLESGGVYHGSDCSSFVSMCQWGVGSSNASMNSSKIASSSLYTTISDWKSMRPGDVIWKSGHVMLFLYYANEAHTEFVCIEQGGDGGKVNGSWTNTVTCTIKEYNTKLYTVRRPKH